MSSDKQTNITEREWSVFESDRIKLIGAATDMFCNVQLRRALADSAIRSDQPEEFETDAYRSACAFLKREFDKGAMSAESHLKSSKEDSSWEASTDDDKKTDEKDKP